MFFDRDGVVNRLVRDPITGRPESPLATEDVALFPGAAAALARLRSAGFLLVGVSNQPAVAKGTVSLELLRAVQRRVEKLLEQEGVTADAFRLCLHHPDGVVEGLAGTCDCRKPAPGMLLGAASELGIDLCGSWMIGDTDADIAAGAAAGCRTVLIEHGESVHKRSRPAVADECVADLSAAADLIVGSRPR